jgi:hypothetical protein
MVVNFTEKQDDRRDDHRDDNTAKDQDHDALSGCVFFSNALATV